MTSHGLDENLSVEIQVVIDSVEKKAKWLGRLRVTSLLMMLSSIAIAIGYSLFQWLMPEKADLIFWVALISEVLIFVAYIFFTEVFKRKSSN